MARRDNSVIKDRTQELYDSLPMDKEQRIACTSIRDEIIKINYKFFGYVASSVFIENVAYEDKLQTALLAFLEMWWKYKWTPKYRGDLSFAVFFKPRLVEEIRRALCPVKYTVRRWACKKAADQLGKHWTEVTYEDLALVDLPEQDIQALKAIFKSATPANIDDYEQFFHCDDPITTIESYMTDEYNSVEELLIQEMIEREAPLTDDDLKKIADMYCMDYLELKRTLPQAMKVLHKRLTDNLV